MFTAGKTQHKNCWPAARTVLRLAARVLFLFRGDIRCVCFRGADAFFLLRHFIVVCHCLSLCLSISGSRARLAFGLIDKQLAKRNTKTAVKTQHWPTLLGFID